MTIGLMAGYFGRIRSELRAAWAKVNKTVLPTAEAGQEEIIGRDTVKNPCPFEDSLFMKTYEVFRVQESETVAETVESDFSDSTESGELPTEIIDRLHLTPPADCEHNLAVAYCCLCQHVFPIEGRDSTIHTYAVTNVKF